jgi:signal transduction histidine kinase
MHPDRRARRLTASNGAILLALLTCLLPGTVPARGAVIPVIHREDRVHHEIQDLEQVWRQGVLENSVPTATRLLADDYLGINPNGTLETKADALAALAAAGAALVIIRRRRRPVDLTCERAWHQLRRLLARRASIAWSDATTPRAAVRTVQDRLVERTGASLDGPALDALVRLASAVEQERSAPRPQPTTSAELHRWLATVRHAVEQQVNGQSRRDAGPSALPSES